MQRILFYNHTRQVSGAERVLVSMLTVLDRARYSAVVACPLEGPGNLETLVGEAVAVPVLQARFTSNPMKLLGYLRSFASTMLAFRRTVAEVDPDLLHANSVRAGIVATAATMGTSRRILWHVHDDLPAHPISVVIRVFAWVSRRTQFVAVSRATARAFCGRLDFGARMHVLPNSVDAGRFPAKTAPRDAAAQGFREELGLRADDFLMVAMGMISPRKGLLELLEIFAEVQRNLLDQRRRPAHLAIVGAAIFNDDYLYEAKLRAHVEKLGLTDSVRLTGQRSDTPAILRATDLLVHNAKVEPFGLVVLEAMASGTPVIAAEVGGIPEIIEAGVNGRLIPSPEERFYRADEVRCETILGAVVDPASSAELSAAALRETVPRFGMDRFGVGLQALYARVLG